MTGGTRNISLGVESIKGFAGKIVQSVLGFVGTIVFARILGPKSFGGFYFLLALVFLADKPLRGTATAISKRFSESENEPREIVGSIALFYGIGFLLAGGALLLLSDVLQRQTNVSNAALVFFLLLTSITLFDVVQELLAASGYPSLQIWNDTLRSILTFPFQIGFVLLGFSAAGMGYGLAAATFLSIPGAIYFIRLRPARPSLKTLRSLWKFARYSVPSAIVGTAYGRLDMLLLGSLLTTSAAANYQIALKLTTPAVLVATSIAPALFPKVSNLHSRGENVAEEISNVVSFSSIIAIPIFFGVIAIPEVLVVTIYGGEYRSAALLLIGLAAFQVVTTQASMYDRAVNAIDRPELNFRFSSIALVFNIVVGVTLLYEIGAIGVVIATVLSEILRYLLFVFALQRELEGLTVLPRTLFEQFAAGSIMYATVEAAERAVVVQSWVDLVLLVGTGAVVYGVVLLAISPGLRLTLRSVYADAMA
jgi:O-antigen/teichoic acid export membrane protein